MLSLRDECSNALWPNLDVEQGSANFFFNGKMPRPFFWADSQATREKIMISGIPSALNYFVDFYSIYTIYKCGCGSRFGDP
jgi:hypothetical protein